MKKTYNDGCYEADFSCSYVAKGVRTDDEKAVFIKRWHVGDKRAMNEIKVPEKVENASIPAFFDVFEEDGMIYAVRDWIDALTLRELILREKQLDISKALDIMIKICMVMRDIYDSCGSFVHADIRPSNFLYDDISKNVWFIDTETMTFFEGHDDISGLLQLGGYTVSPSVEGFSAPEVFEGNICVQSDIFSLGKLFGFLIGVCGFDGKFISRRKIKHYKSAVDIVHKCTNLNKSERYETVGILLDALCGLFNSVASESSDRIIDFDVVQKRIQNEKNTGSVMKNKIVYVGENRCFASEFSYTAAGYNNLKTLLLGNDDYYGAGNFDYFLDMRNKRDISLVSETATPFFCDCRHLYLTDEKQWAVRGILTNSRNEKLYVSDCDMFTEFEINEKSDADALLSWSDKYFDMTVICDSGYSSGLSGVIMSESDYIIVPVKPDIDKVYAAFKRYKQYSIKYKFPAGRIIFVAWEYEDGISMPLNDFKIAVDGQYGGFVPYDVERIKSKNIKGDIYCERCSDKIFSIYSKLIDCIIARNCL